MSKQLPTLERRSIPAMPNTERGLKSLPAWLVSLVLHATLILGIGFLWVANPNGTGGEKNRPVGVAMVYESNSGEEYRLSDASASGNQSEVNSAESLESLLPNENTAPGMTNQSALDAVLPGSIDAGGSASEAAGDLGLGEGNTQLGSVRKIPKVKTSVFGIEGEGTRFLYVFDRSDSMNGYNGRPFQAAKSQLLKSMESLGEAHQFQVIFYNDTPRPYGGLQSGAPRILTGSDNDKRSAQRFVREIIATGGTQHVDAMRMAINLSPDVIFFLTDADTAPSQRELDRLLISASRVGATIHTIQFGKGSNQTGGGWIKFFAESSGGKFRYIDVTTLGDNDAFE